MTSALFILFILFLNIALCEWLVANTRLKHFGTALLVIVLTAITANAGIIPSSTDAPPLYDGIFSFVAPLAIFLLLLEVNFDAIKKAGLPILLIFLLGSIGTMVGVFAGSMAIGGGDKIGEFFPQIAGMFTGTYTGGSINFNAVALEYNMNKEGNLYAGAVAIDNILTAFWMVMTIALPKFLHQYWPRKKQLSAQSDQLSLKDTHDIETISPSHISILLALGFVSLLASDLLSEYCKQHGIMIPSILILTTISLVLAQVPLVKKLKGSRVMGILGIYLFLAVIGAYCDFATLPGLGSLAYYLLIFVSVTVIVHGVVIFGVGALFKQDWDIISIASQCNVGGSGSALALARSLDRADLLLPAILLGTMGNALGTYLGFMMVGFF